MSLKFGNVALTCFSDHVETRFVDGTRSLFYPPVDSEDFCKIALQFGYPDTMQYGIEHDVTHSWVATVRGFPYSEVVWADAHGGRRDKSARIYDDDEHIVNRVLFYINTGKVDDDFGMLRHVFGNALAQYGQQLWYLLRVRIPEELITHGL
jgi:hypothetical protein